jgi:MerR family transcriptional regulator, light-induced transcriptional regulator
MHEHLTPKQVARAIGVSEASLKRWCDKGLIHSVRTAGGHRRLPLADVMSFLRKSGHPLVSPEVLGLPAVSSRGEVVVDHARNDMRNALENGDTESFRRTGFNLFLAGHSALSICDRVIAPVFHELGSRWQHGDIEVYQERRACDMCVRFLHELRPLVHRAPSNAPYAIVTTAEHDPYWIPMTMIDLVLHEAGWNSECLGTCNPLPSVKAALKHRKPRLLCLSISVVLEDEEKFLEHYRELYQAAEDMGTAVAIGGRAITPELRSKMMFTKYNTNLEDFVTFAKSLSQKT